MSVDTDGIAANAGDGAKAANNAASAWRRFMGIPSVRLVARSNVTRSRQCHDGCLDE
jgi:hypothetical protein